MYCSLPQGPCDRFTYRNNIHSACALKCFQGPSRENYLIAMMILADRSIVCKPSSIKKTANFREKFSLLNLYIISSSFKIIVSVMIYESSENELTAVCTQYIVL